jgi:uncharacterized protein YxjI
VNIPSQTVPDPVGAVPPVSTVSTDATGLLSATSVVMKKKIFSMREHYDFEDPSGTKLGEGDGNFFQMPASFSVKSIAPGGSTVPVMEVRAKLISLRHEFTLFDNSGSVLGSMKKKIIKLIGQEYWLEQNGTEMMRIFGNFTDHNYKMTISGQEVAQVHKKWVSVRDQFGISITGKVDPRLVIGSVIVIEHLEVTQKQNSNNGPFGLPF